MSQYKVMVDDNFGAASDTSPASVQANALAVALLALMTAQMAAGAATLVLGGSALASFLHEVGAIFLLAGAFVVLGAGRAMPRADQG
jgi:heme A synthase